MLRSAPLIVVLVLLNACGPTHASLKQARTAVLINDYEAAYRAYSQVLDRKPTHTEAITGRNEARQQVLADAAANIEQLLEGGRLDAVAGAIDKARQFQPESSWIQAQEARWEAAWTERLTTNRNEAAGRASLGETWVYASALAEFSKEPAHQAAADTAWTALREAEWPRVTVAASGDHADVMRAVVIPEWARGAWSEVPVVAGVAGANDIGVAFQVQQRDCRTEKLGTRAGTHTYKDGTMVPNPAIRRLQGELRATAQDESRAITRLEQLRVSEDEAFRRVEETKRGLASIKPAVDAAIQAVAETEKARDRAAARVKESEDAAATLRSLAPERTTLATERTQKQQSQSTLERELGAAEAGLARANEVLQNADAKLADATARHKTATHAAELARKALATTDATRIEIQAALGELGAQAAPPDTAFPAMSELRAVNDDTKADLEAARRGHQEVTAARDRNAADSAKAETALTAAEAQVVALNTEKDQLRAEQAAAVTPRSGEITSRLALLQDELADVRAESLAAGTRLDALSAARVSLDAAVTEAAGKLDTAEAAHRTAQVQLLQARLRDVRADLARRSTELEVAERAAAKTEGELETVRTTARQAREDHTTLEAKVTSTRDELATVKTRLAAIESRSRAIEQESARLEPVAADLPSRRRDLERDTRAVRTASIAADQARAESDRLSGMLEGVEQTHQDLRSNRLSAEQSIQSLQQRRAALDADLRAQPDKIELEKEATYSIATHRRTCVVTASFATSSPTAAAAADSATFTSVDEDDTWRARSNIQLAGDPLAFPKDDDEALAALTNEAAGKVGAALRTQVRSEGQGRRAKPAQGLDESTRLVALAHFMDPDTSMQRFLDAKYELPRRTKALSGGRSEGLRR